MSEIILDRKIIPSFVVPEKFDFQKVDSFQFKNGVFVHTLSASDIPIVKLEFSFQGGTSQDAASFNSYFAAKLLDQGTRKKTNEEIAEFIAFRGAHLEIISGNEKIIFVVFTLKKYIEEVCNLLHEIINESKFEESNLARIKANEAQNLEVKETKTSHLAGVEFVSKLFPNHYYGSRLHSSNVDRIQLDDLKVFYKQFLVGASFELCASGAIDDAVLKTLESIFGTDDLKNNSSKEQNINAQESGKFLLPREGAVQSSIRYGFQTIGKTHEDYTLLSITNEIFGGYFGSRLMTNIREDKGYTYGISSNIIQLKNASYFQIGTDIKAENAQDTLDEIKKEIDIMCQTPISLEELEKVRNYIFGSFAISLNTSFELMDKFRAVHLLGLNYDFYNRYFDVLKSVTPQQVQDISQKYLSQEAVIVTCG